MESERPKKKLRLEVETEKDGEILRLKNRVKELEKSLLVTKTVPISRKPRVVS